MQRQITIWCQTIMENWHNATLYDFAFAMAWILIGGFLISRLTVDARQ